MAFFVRTTKEVVDHCINSTPPGQLPSMITHLQSLIPDTMTRELAEGAAFEYNKTHARVASVADGRKLVYCDTAVIDKHFFLDPKTNSVFKINHLTMEAEISSSHQPPVKKQFEPYRVAVESTLEGYVKKRFPSPKTAWAVYATSGGLIVQIVVENLNERNMWAGLWDSRWVLVMKDGKSADVEGHIRVHAHYHEGRLKSTLSPFVFMINCIRCKHSIEDIEDYSFEENIHGKNRRRVT